MCFFSGTNRPKQVPLDTGEPVDEEELRSTEGSGQESLDLTGTGPGTGLIHK